MNCLSQSIKEWWENFWKILGVKILKHYHSDYSYKKESMHMKNWALKIWIFNCQYKSAFQINILDELLEQTCQVEEKILEYSSHFFDSTQRKVESQHGNEKYRGMIYIIGIRAYKSNFKCKYRLVYFLFDVPKKYFTYQYLKPPRPPVCSFFFFTSPPHNVLFEWSQTKIVF